MNSVTRSRDTMKWGAGWDGASAVSPELPCSRSTASSWATEPGRDRCPVTPPLCFLLMKWEHTSLASETRATSFRGTHPCHWCLPHTSRLLALLLVEPHPQAYLSLPLWQISRLHRPFPRRRLLPRDRDTERFRDIKQQHTTTLEAVIVSYKRHKLLRNFP